MVASDLHTYRQWRKAEQEITGLRHQDSMITEREFEKRKRARKIAKASQKRNRYLQ